jgi:arginase family enzyme
MQLFDYLHPVSSSILELLAQSCSPKSLFHQTQFVAPKTDELGNYQLAVLGIPEDRFQDKLNGCSEAPDSIRMQLYALMKPRIDVKILDLGNIIKGNSFSDTHIAVKEVVHALIVQKVPVLILGGSEDLIAAQYKAYKGIQSNLQMVVVDSRVNMQIHAEEEKQSYLPRIITAHPNYLFNITQAGYQSYFVEPETYDAFERMNFDMLRLGALRGNIQDLEPYCRNADMLAFSMNAIRASDAPAQQGASPNGFNGEEACQIARYAGASNDISSFGIYNLLPHMDQGEISIALAAQMAWFFIEGIMNRRMEYPSLESNDYMIYRTTSKNADEEIVFYKSLMSNRWWMEVPYPRERSHQEGKFLVPCSYKDYQSALNEELPDRWLKTYQKLL